MKKQIEIKMSENEFLTKLGLCDFNLLSVYDVFEVDAEDPLKLNNIIRIKLEENNV